MPNSLRTLRRRARLTQPELAARAGVDQTTISMLELGRHPNPRATTIVRLARALETSVDAVFLSLQVTVRRQRAKRRQHDDPASPASLR